MKGLITTILTGFLALTAVESAMASAESDALKACKKEIGFQSMKGKVKKSPAVVRQLDECVAKKTGK